MLTLSLNSRDSIVNDEFNKRKFNIPSLDLEKILRPMIIEMQAAESQTIDRSNLSSVINTNTVSHTTRQISPVLNRDEPSLSPRTIVPTDVQITFRPPSKRDPTFLPKFPRQIRNLKYNTLLTKYEKLSNIKVKNSKR